jgi:hypothetical protein
MPLQLIVSVLFARHTSLHPVCVGFALRQLRELGRTSRSARHARSGDQMSATGTARKGFAMTSFRLFDGNVIVTGASPSQRLGVIFDRSQAAYAHLPDRPCSVIVRVRQVPVVTPLPPPVGGLLGSTPLSTRVL